MTPPRWRAYAARYWRGDFSLRASFWAYAVALGLLAAGTVAFDRLAFPGYSFLRSVALTAFFLVLAAASAWLCVGLWRSASRVIAERQKRGQFAIRAELARGFTALGFLALVGGSGATLLPDAWNALPSLPAVGERIVGLLPRLPAAPDRPSIEAISTDREAPEPESTPSQRPGAPPVTSETVDRTLGEIPSFAALKRRDPERYTQVVERIVSGSREGKRPADLLADASAPLRAVVAKHRSLAGDDIQVRLARLLSDEARLLAPEHPAECAAMLSGGRPPPSAAPASADRRRTAGVPIRDSGGWAPPYALSLLPPEARERDVRIAAEIIDSGATAPSDAVMGQMEARTEIAQAWSRVQARTGLNPEDFEQAPASVEKQRTSCLLMSAFFEEIAGLPSERAGALMRFLNR